MLTTKQVRTIMYRYGRDSYGMYTNKTTDYKGVDRRVKVYYRGDQDAALVAELKRVAGEGNVTVTPGSGIYGGGPGIVVKCQLA